MLKVENIESFLIEQFPFISLDTYGCLLKRLRERHEVSQQELSNRTNLSISFISSIENGQSATSICNAAAICNALNVPICTIFEATARMSRLKCEDKHCS